MTNPWRDVPAKPVYRPPLWVFAAGGALWLAGGAALYYLIRWMGR